MEIALRINAKHITLGEKKMDGKSYKEFLFSIRNCSDNRLNEIITAAQDERNKREEHYALVKDVAEKISKIESDW
tara:strand:- start:3223 stop:3447 length:225 start_codon:yes stop_codon:yes gene_type:complete